MNTFWRRIFAPEIIFAVSAAAALSPYLLWYFGFKLPRVERLELTYIPVIVWGVGLTSFLAGARLARRRTPSSGIFRLSQQNLPINLLLYIGAALVLVQVYFAVRDVYGFVPLLEYLSRDGSLDIVMANDQQQFSASGQIGLLTASLYALNALFLASILQYVTWRRGSRVLLAIVFLVTAFAHLMNAKRGGIYSTALYLLVGIAIYFGNPATALSALAPGRSRLLARSLMIAVPVTLVFAFGYIASIRTRGRVEASTGEIVAYLQYPLINFEAQCQAAGFGPGDFKILAPLRYLTPYKYAELSDVFVSKTPRLILDSPSGMYEDIHWCWGIWGVISFSLLLGFVARWLYERALESLTCLLSYCYFAVALALAHTANQVLILAYVPVPLVFVVGLTAIVSTDRGRLPRNPRRPASDRRAGNLLLAR